MSVLSALYSRLHCVVAVDILNTYQSCTHSLGMCYHLRYPFWMAFDSQVTNLLSSLDF